MSGSTNRGSGGTSRPLRWRRNVNLAALVALAFIASLIAGELTLQLAGVVTHSLMSRNAPMGAGESDAIRILCVGDSHTYGLPLPEEQSYPAQLERALEIEHPEHRFEVVNLGVPGLNSAFVANRLERQLFQIQPDLVIVWVGINNLWNVVESRRVEREDPWLAVRQPLMRLKLFRLGSIAWFNAVGHRYDPGQRGAWYDGERRPSGRMPKGVELPDPAPGLAYDLERMTRLAAAVDVPILLVTYPMRTQRSISRVIRQTGGRLGVGVIDTRQDLDRALTDGHGSAELIDTQAGPHPSGLLYAYVVESMLPEVTSTLAAWHELALGPSDPAASARARNVTASAPVRR